jgi:hypothetical protein
MPFSNPRFNLGAALQYATPTKKLETGASLRKMG